MTENKDAVELLTMKARSKIIQLLWEKQFEGTPWAGKFHLLRLDSLEADYGSLADAILAAICAILAVPPSNEANR